MRILTTKKIYRAFPELDQLDDEACVRFIRRMWGLQNVWKFWIILIVLLPISLIVWLAIMLATSGIFDLSVFPVYSEILTLMEPGFVGFPLMVMFFVRDFWLSQQIRKRIDGVGCKDCEYCLVGLEIKQSKTGEYVLCPECGEQNVLDDIRLSREDIDPSFLVDTQSNI